MDKLPPEIKLPDEVIKQIEQEATQAMEPMKLSMISRGRAWDKAVELLTKYATTLHAIQQERDNLSRILSEADQLLKPIIEYGQSKEAGIPLGHSITKVILERAKRLLQVEQERDAYRKALEQAVTIIKHWHGDRVFDIYYNHSPEMKPIREVLAAYQGDKGGKDGK